MSVTSHPPSRSLVQVRPSESRFANAVVAQLVRAGTPQGVFHLLPVTLLNKLKNIKVP
jgi:hypothetical protein